MSPAFGPGSSLKRFADMMNCMMSEGFFGTTLMWGAGLVALAHGAALILAIAALGKYVSAH